MRIKTTQSKNQGSVILVTLCTAWIIGIALVSYLTLVANQNRTTYHSQSWSACIPVLESGIEEALTQLNFNNVEGLANAEQHGWVSNNGVFTKTRMVNDIDRTYYVTTIDPVAGPTPTITSTGYVPAPGFTGKALGGETAFGMILGTVTPSAPVMVSRTVVVKTKLQSSVQPKGGLRAKGKIKFSGTSSLDSFDSSDPNYSTNGRYDATKRKANGIALTNSSANDAVHVDDAQIYGSVTTGPGNGTVTVGGGSVGDLGWISGGVTGQTGTDRIQTGHLTSDANVQFDDVVEPFVWGSGSTPVSGSVAGTNYTYVADAVANSIWNIGSINISAGKSLVVSGGDVTLYVNGNFTTSGSGYVYIAPGASLKLYVAGTLSVSGTGVMNGTGYASKLSVFGLGTTAKNWAYSGSSAFIGTIYSPYNNFTLSGTAGAFGSFTANSVTITGGASVHYDETLSGSNDAEYVVVSWNEI